MSPSGHGMITITFGDERAATDIGSGGTEERSQTRIEPDEEAESPAVLQYGAEAARLLAGLFAARLQRPGLVERMVVSLDVDG